MAKIKRAVKQAASKQKTAAQKRAATIKRNKAAAEKKRKEALARGRRRSNIAGLAAIGTIATTTPIMLSRGKKKANQTTNKNIQYIDNAEILFSSSKILFCSIFKILPATLPQKNNPPSKCIPCSAVKI